MSRRLDPNLRFVGDPQEDALDEFFASECGHRFPPDAPPEVLAWRCVDCGEWIQEFAI